MAEQMKSVADNPCSVRSYVRRGRMTVAQRRALQQHATRYLVSPHDFSAPAGAAEWARVFARRAPLVVEIGSGYGEATAALAAAERGRNYLALEVHQPGIGALMNRLEAENITNVRIVADDALSVLNTLFADSTVAAFHIFFPDPWPKRKHHKRRLLRPAVLPLLLDKLSAGGGIYFVSDWQPYIEAADALLSATPALVAAPPPPRAPTGYEQRARAAGRTVRELYFRYQSAPC